MSRTIRRHESQAKAAHRGPKNRPHERANDKLKSAKQLRARGRESLRREEWR